jgi:hypothetical protein
MFLLLFYAVTVAGILWYTLGYLPFIELTANISFALNIAQLSLLSLLSFLVYRQEKHYRSIFFQLWFLYLALALSVPVVYHFWFWSGKSAGIIAYALALVIIHSLMAWTVANILFTYVFKDEKRWAVNGLTALVVLPIVLWLFWPYYWSPERILLSSYELNPAVVYAPIQKSAIIVNLISLLSLLAFFLHKYKTDRPIGAYADTLLFLFGLSFAVDTAEMFAQVSSVELMSITQWANGIVLAGMNISLLLRLKYKSQRIAEYYESQCLSLDPRIDRRVGIFDRIILWCFFDPKKVGARIFLGTGESKVEVKRHTPRSTNSFAKKHDN